MNDALKLVLTHGPEISDLGRRSTDEVRASPERGASPNAHAIRVAE
jgi:hypothetical protein